MNGEAEGSPVKGGLEDRLKSLMMEVSFHKTEINLLNQRVTSLQSDRDLARLHIDQLQDNLEKTAARVDRWFERMAALVDRWEE